MPSGNGTTNTVFDDDTGRCHFETVVLPYSDITFNESGNDGTRTVKARSVLQSHSDTSPFSYIGGPPHRTFHRIWVSETRWADVRLKRVIAHSPYCSVSGRTNPSSIGRGGVRATAV